MWAIYDSEGQQRSGLDNWEAIQLVAANHDPNVYCLSPTQELRWNAGINWIEVIPVGD